MKTNNYYLGMDVSKDKLDFALVNDNDQMSKSIIPNNLKGFKELITWLKEKGATPQNTHVCLEATGVYDRP